MSRTWRDDLRVVRLKASTITVDFFRRPTRRWALQSCLASDDAPSAYGLTAVPSRRRTGSQYPGCAGSGYFFAFSSSKSTPQPGASLRIA